MSIKLARYKTTPYTVNFENKKYIWIGSKGKQISIKNVSQDMADFLAMGNAIRLGELVVVEEEDNEEAKQLIEQLGDKDEYDANSMSKEDISKVLTGKNLKVMQDKLNEITSDTTKKFVLTVAKEIKLSNANKQKFLKEWLGLELPIEDIFTYNEE